MRLIFITILMCYAFSTFSQDKGIQFRPFISFEDAYKMANAEGKQIFIVCGFKGCGWCLRQKKDVFPLQRVGDFYNSKFVCFDIDIHEGAGDTVLKVLKPKGFPAMYFLNGKGELKYTMQGYRGEDALLQGGEAALDSTKQLPYMRRMINNGNYTLNQLAAFIMMVRDSSYCFDLIDKSVKEEISKFGYTKDVWNIVNLDFFCTKHYMNFILENESKFEATIGKSTVDDLIEQKFSFDIYRCHHPLLYFRKIKAIKNLKALNHPLTGRILKNADLALSKARYNRSPSKRKWKKAIRCSNEYFLCNSYNLSDLHRAAEFIYWNYKKYRDTTALRLAKELEIKNIAVNSNFNSLNLLADICLDLGEKDHARKLMNDALDHAEKANQVGNIEKAKRKIDKLQL